MNPAWLTAMAIIGGSALGGVMSLAATWLTQRFHVKADRVAKHKSKLQALYEDFIDEGAKLYAHALVQQTPDSSVFVGLFATIGKMRVLSSPAVVAAAEEVVRTIIETYAAPNKSFHELRGELNYSAHPLRGFSNAARAEISSPELARSQTLPPLSLAV